MPVDLRSVFTRILLETYAGKPSYYNEEQISSGCSNRASEYEEIAKRLGINLYTLQLPQPDLVAEIEQLRLENAAMKAEWEKAYEIGMLAKQQLSEAQSRIELLEHDAKTGDYETLYAQTVVELSAAQASEADLLEALETLACLGNGDIYGNSHGNVIAQQAITTHKTRKGGK